MKVSDKLRVNVVVPDLGEGARPAAVDVGSQRIETQLLDALDTVAALAREASLRMDRALDAASPDEVAIELGVVVGTTAGVLLASGSVEGQLKVTMTWKRE
jgi:hypothetical protein